jgi:hypothetical protein
MTFFTGECLQRFLLEESATFNGGCSQEVGGKRSPGANPKKKLFFFFVDKLEC